MKKQSLLFALTLMCATAGAALTGCGGSSSKNANGDFPSLGALNGSFQSSGTNTQGFPSCVSSDPNKICIGLKVVSYKDGSGNTVLDQNSTVTMVNGMNQVWSQCNIAFQLEKYSAVDPSAYGLAYSPNWQNDGDTIRSKFEESNTFLVVAVGPWTDATIAVTEMPGAGVYGTLVDQQYAKNPLTVGHELGHYMGLYHITDSSNLMNPYIGPNTSGLNSSQCSTARSTDQSDWQAMMRH